MHWLASVKYALWAFYRGATCYQVYHSNIRVYLSNTSSDEVPSELEPVGSGDVASTKALIGSQVF